MTEIKIFQTFKNCNPDHSILENGNFQLFLKMKKQHRLTNAPKPKGCDSSTRQMCRVGEKC